MTQTSLLNAENAKAGKTSGKSGAAKTSGKTAASSAKTEVMLTKAEKELVTLYRKADASTKESVMSMLKTKSQSQELIQNLIGGAITSMLGGKK